MASYELTSIGMIMNAGETLYRASHVLDLTEDAKWFSLDESIAHKYAQSQGDNCKIYELMTTKPFKLLNICNTSFQIDLINKLNLMFRGTNCDGIDERKDLALCPIGLPDHHTQFAYLKKLQIPIDVDVDRRLMTAEYEQQLQIYKSYFGERYRCSVYELDKQMVSLLKKIYRDYDGYIIPIRMPCILPNRGWFHQEICLFDTSNGLRKVSEKALAGGGKKKRHVSKGGGISDSVVGRMIRLPDGKWGVCYEMGGFDSHEEYLRVERSVWGDVDPSDAYFFRR